MNFRLSFQIPQQSFPTDVTSPSPTQLPGGHSDVSPADEKAVPAKPPRKQEKEPEDEEAAAACGLTLCTV